MPQPPAGFRTINVVGLPLRWHLSQLLAARQQQPHASQRRRPVLDELMKDPGRHLRPGDAVLDDRPAHLRRIGPPLWMTDQACARKH